MKNLSLLTYTHSNVRDLHRPYFERILRFFPEMDNIYFTCNERVPYGQCIVYDDRDAHYQQMIQALEAIPTEYVLYSQEDYILFDYVNVDALDTCIEVMQENKRVAFVRLIQSGLGKQKREYDANFNLVDPNSEYYFSAQATIWRKSVLADMYRRSKVDRIFDEVSNSKHLRRFFRKGLYGKERGKRIGNHFNSAVYPYIATAIVRGKWNLKQYRPELEALFDEFNINPNLRGSND